MAGIEPASAVFSIGILRAQPLVSCQEGEPSGDHPIPYLRCDVPGSRRRASIGLVLLDDAHIPTRRTRAG